MNANEVLRIVDSLHREKHIEKEIVFVAIESALVSAARKHFGEEADIEFIIDRQSGEIAGRNGIGFKNALENRIIGTKSRGVYESPGMELLGQCLTSVYQATMDRRALALFESWMSH